MRVTLFTHLQPDQAEGRLRAALCAQAERRSAGLRWWRVAGSVRHRRFALRAYIFNRYGGWVSLRGRLMATATGTLLDCTYGVPVGIAVLATTAVIMMAFGAQPPSAALLPRAVVSGAAGAFVAMVLAFGLPKAMWGLWEGEFVGFLKDALDTTLLRDEQSVHRPDESGKWPV